MKRHTILFAWLMFSLVIFTHCNKNNTATQLNGLPVVDSITTADLSDITDIHATLSPTVSSDGGSPVTSRGICWGTSPDPGFGGDASTNADGTGKFVGMMTELLPFTHYYARAYARNKNGVAFSNNLVFRTRAFSNDSLVDIDGNVYNVVKIGNQYWMKENLKVTKYNDGTAIPNLTDSAAWADNITGAYCNYNNDENNVARYVRLYNFYAAHSSKLAPIGWHVPSEADWTTLINTLGGDVPAGEAMKADSKYWLSPNLGSSLNSSNFTALPAGERNVVISNPFIFLNQSAIFWTTGGIPSNARAYSLYNNHTYISLSTTVTDIKWGISCRCVKD